MRKKSQIETGVIIWIVAIIAGLVLAKYSGLFATYTPTTPDTSLNSIVNKIYYSTATTQPSWPCAVQTVPTVIGRSCCPGSNCCGSHAFPRVIMDVCTPGHYYDCGEATSGTHDVPIQDLPGKYACSNGNVVTRYCSSFPETPVETCSLPCTFSATYQISGVATPVVQCGGMYKPNQNICSSDAKILFQTDATGTLKTGLINGIQYPQTCGWQCQNGQCIACQSNTGQCTGNIPQTCDGTGNWQNGTACTGLTLCKVSGTTASCSSSFSEGDKRCSGNQPQIYHGAPTNNFVNNGNACTTSCDPLTTLCTNQCTGPSCQNATGTLFTCNISTTGNTLVQGATCNSRICASDNLNCVPQYTKGTSYCIGSSIQTAITDTTSGSAASGGVRLDSANAITCTIGCNSTGTPSCIKLSQCIGKHDENICEGFNIKTCSSTEESVSQSKDCTVELSSTQATCDSTSGTAICTKPAAQCTGNFVCHLNSIYNCQTSGLWGTVKDNCNLKGCSGNTQATSQCTDECTGTNVCDGTKSYQCNQVNSGDVDSTQKIKGNYTECGTAGCNSDNGLCRTSCTPNANYCSSGVLRSCTSTGQPGNVLDTCNGKGCEGSTCKDECPTLDVYSCSGTNSQVCFKNNTNNQSLLQTITCGNEGCDSSTGKCKAVGAPNSFTCIGSAIYATDSVGSSIGNPIKICANEPKMNTLQPYCSEGIGNCKVCEVPSYLCLNNVLGQCGDSFTGTLTNTQTCEAGCSVSGNTVCDHLSYTVNPTQNFFASDSVSISGNLKGSQSENPIQTSYSATITGQGVSNTLTGTSDTNGNLNINFGQKPLGSYTVKITLLDFSIDIDVNSKVTNSYKIEIDGDPVASVVQNGTGIIHLKAADSQSNPPDDIIVSTSPQGLNIVAKKTSVSGKWNLEVSGSSGIYQVGLKPVKDGISIDEQTLSIELRKPVLSITTTAPKSDTRGEKNYDINILAASQPIQPDSVTATISKGTSSSLTLQKLGSGVYTFSNNFDSVGTYTLNVNANLAGYEPVSFSQPIEISDSGKVDPPGDQNKTGCTLNSDCTNGQTCTNGECVGKQDYNTYIIIGVIGVLAWLIFGRKK